MEREEKFTPDEVNFTDYMVEKIAATIRGGEIMGTVKDNSISRDLERLACLIIAAPEMYECICDALTDLDMPEGMRAHFEEVLKKARGEE